MDFYEQIVFTAKVLKKVFGSCLRLQRIYNKSLNKLSLSDKALLKKESSIMKRLFMEGLKQWKKTRYDKDKDNDLNAEIPCVDHFIRRLGANELLLRRISQTGAKQ